MKSTPTPHVATGVLAEETEVTFGATGSHLQYTVSVPAGTACRKLDGGSDPWVVQDLSFLDRKAMPLMYHDAYYYGIRVPEEKITDIKVVNSRPYRCV